MKYETFSISIKECMQLTSDNINSFIGFITENYPQISKKSKKEAVKQFLEEKEFELFMPFSKNYSPYLNFKEGDYAVRDWYGDLHHELKCSETYPSTEFRLKIFKDKDYFKIPIKYIFHG